VGGPEWGTASEELNATILAWEAGEGPAEHVNHERDVALIVIQGALHLVQDGEERLLLAGEATIVPKGATRKLTAGPEGVRYASVHRKRGGLGVASRRRQGQTRV
jgi:quercetin dioxygenase-like cupin family protein